MATKTATKPRCTRIGLFFLQKLFFKITLYFGAFSELFFLGKSDLLSIKTTEKGANPQKEIVLFPDQLTALKKLFN